MASLYAVIGFLSIYTPVFLIVSSAGALQHTWECLQDGLTSVLADLLEEKAEWRDVVMLTLAAVGRGGQGDVGQRIRDEILYVQSRNNAKVCIPIASNVSC